MKERSKKLYTTRENIETLQALIEDGEVLIKETAVVCAFQEAASAMEEQGGNAMYLHVLQYHLNHEDALLFPDALTKGALNAAKRALLCKNGRENNAEN